MRKKVIVGMSGGVDSSVAALLLKEQGYDVVGITMELVPQGTVADCPNGGSCGASAVQEAGNAAASIGIPHYVVDFRAEFREKVIGYFIEEYRRGRTPNPCIACNRYIKWQALLQYAERMQADYIATGHYAKVVRLDNGRYTVCKSATAQKDQTYVLYTLSQDQLMHTLMPVGEYTKEQVRAIAERTELAVAHTADSQDICFVPDHDYAGFIERETNQVCRQGEFVDLDGNVLGIHRGIEHYTVGQRRGLGIASSSPLYVYAIEPASGRVVLADDSQLYSSAIVVEDVNYMGTDVFAGEKTVVGKVRYAHRGAPCKIHVRADGLLECVFEQAQRAITPGQSVVFYEGDNVACGGVICGGLK